MMRLTYHNCSDDCVQIILSEENKMKVLEPNSSFDFISEKNSISFSVGQHIDAESRSFGLFGAVIAFLVSIPLWLINYFEIEFIDKSIKQFVEKGTV